MGTEHESIFYSNYMKTKKKTFALGVNHYLDAAL